MLISVCLCAKEHCEYMVYICETGLGLHSKKDGSKDVHLNIHPTDENRCRFLASIEFVLYVFKTGIVYQIINATVGVWCRHMPVVAYVWFPYMLTKNGIKYRLIPLS